MGRAEHGATEADAEDMRDAGALLVWLGLRDMHVLRDIAHRMAAGNKHKPDRLDP